MKLAKNSWIYSIDDKLIGSYYGIHNETLGYLLLRYQNFFFNYWYNSYYMSMHSLYLNISVLFIAVWEFIIVRKIRIKFT